jgi:hypothetical protein
MRPKIPQSLKLEHEELHSALVEATKAGGKTAEAAKAVANVLHPHFVKEEEIAQRDRLVTVIGKRKSQSSDGQHPGYNGPSEKRVTGDASRT